MVYVGLAIAIVVLVPVILLGFKSRVIYGITYKVAPNTVPIFYVVSWAVFLFLFEKHILIPYYSVFSFLHRVWMRISYSLVFLSFLILYFSDPGRIDRLNWPEHYEMFPFDKILYLQNMECRTCHFSKPARSKHCSYCHSCISMQDHHCIFVNNCIGLRNFKWFTAFLIANTYVFLYGWGLLFYLLKSSIKSAWNNPDRWVFAALIDQGNFQRVGTCLWFLATFLSIMVIGFMCIHLNYVWAGVTTNESCKWDVIKDLIPTRMLYYAPHTDIVLFKRPDGTWNRQLSIEEEQLIRQRCSLLQRVQTEDQLPNIYDHGFYENLKLLLLGRF